MLRIEWQITANPDVYSIVKDIEYLDSSVFHDSGFADYVWNQVYKKISIFIQNRFEEGKSKWKPLSPKYVKWKVSAARRGAQVPVGTFGNRVCKLTSIGRLTDTLYPSATEKRFANIFRVESSDGFNGGTFKYAIDGNKLPYAKYFNNKREFFYLTNAEAEQVFKVIIDKIDNKLDTIWK